MEDHSRPLSDDEIRTKAPVDAAAILGRMPPDRIREVLAGLPIAQALTIAGLLPGTVTEPGADAAALAGKVTGTIEEMMEPVSAVVSEDQTVSSAVDQLVHHATPAEVTYVYVLDAQQRLIGVFGMRDLLMAKPSQQVTDIMVAKPVAFKAGTAIRDALREVMRRQLSRIPVVDANGALIGVVRGWKLMDRVIADVGQQVGSMVGLDREERINTPILEAFRMRHPWLQINLLTAFGAAFIVALFEDTIARVVALAVFLPVLAGQSGNTGCQALAITLRGMTLGELNGFPVLRLLRKELVLGALNGAAVGAIAAIAMWIYAAATGAGQPATLALVIFLAMIGACTGSGLFGVLVPLTLRRFGADPAMASSIFLTTATDVMGMGLMLFLAASMLF